MRRLLIAAAVFALAPSQAAAQASPSPHTNAKRYDLSGRLTGTISADPDGVGSGNPFVAVRTAYDGAGRLIKVESGTLSTWQSEAVAPANWGAPFTVLRTREMTYDAGGRKLTESQREGAAGTIRSMTQYSYNQDGRLECTAVRMNPAIYGSLPTSACTLGTQGTGANDFGPDRITRNVYDTVGQRVQVRRGVGTSVEAAEATWAYSPNGKITAVIDGNGNHATLRYDRYDRQDRWTFPSTTRPGAFNDATQTTALATAGSANAADYEEYSYDANGNRLTLRKRDGTTLGYAYDALNRMTVKTVPERPAPHPWPLTAAQTRDVYYGYDLRNLQLFARFDSTSGEGVTSQYDGFGRLALSTIVMDGTAHSFGYHYDRNGNRTWFDGTSGYYSARTYDGLDRVTSVVDPHGTVVRIGYDAAGRRSGLDSGLTPTSATTPGYDGIGRLASLGHDFAGTGNDVAWSYAHNPAGQINSITRNNDSYAWTGHYAVQRAYTTNGLNQYSAAGSASFTYDANGNLVTSPGPAQNEVLTYTYDVENRLVGRTSTGASPTVTLAYDPLGRLWRVQGAAGTTRFLYDGDALAIETDGAGSVLRAFAHGPGSDKPLVWYEVPGGWRRLYPRADHQGSIVAASGDDGALALVNRYDEYGIPAGTNTGRFQYTGQIWLPEIGMYHYKARIYSPTLGRFLQTDPIGYEDQFNLYAYVGNDPVNIVDPDGQIRRDANGRIVSRTIRGSEGRYGQGSQATYGRLVHIYTDADTRGENPITAFRNNRDGNPRMDTNCHGYTFADGRYSIDNSSVEQILREDGYQEVGAADVQNGDVAIYRENGLVAHSGIVSIGEQGETLVTSKSGSEAGGPRTGPATPGVPNSAWREASANVLFYRRTPPPRPDPSRQH